MNSPPIYTQEHLDKLVAMLTSGVRSMRDGDQWIEYNSMSDLKTAIDNIRLELANGGGGIIVGTKQVTFNKGYQ